MLQLTSPCTVQAKGPDLPKRGDVVSATVHCEKLSGWPLDGDGGYPVLVYETVDGSFEVAIAVA